MAKFEKCIRSSSVTVTEDVPTLTKTERTPPVLSGFQSLV